MKRLKARLVPMVLALLLAVLSLPGTALAYDAITDLDKLCTLTVESKYEGVEFSVYKVCEVDELANFTPTEEFEELSEDIEYLISQRIWGNMATTLASELTGWKNGPAAVKTGTTGKDRKVVFTELSAGLYLVVGKSLPLADGSIFDPTNFMICLPNWEQNGSDDSGEWVYEVSIANKGGEETVPRKALKRWQGVSAANRPSEIKVQLLKTDRVTGETSVEEEFTLSQSNNWSKTWPKLDSTRYTWTVKEVDVPSGFAPEYEYTGGNLVITNHGTTPPPGPGPGSDPDPDPPKSDPDPDPPGDPGKPGDPGTPSDPPEGPPNIPGEDIDDPDTPLSRPPVDEEIEEWDPEDEWDEEEDIDDPDTPLARLPQTGVLWWPVPFLAMGGLFLFVLGWALNRREYEE